MYNQLYVFDGNRPKEAVIRNYTEDDFESLINVQKECFPPPFPKALWWSREQLTEHITRFPQGALCVEVEGEIAGSVSGLVVDFDPDSPAHTWSQITDDGYITNHDENGNTLYVVDIAVMPRYRKMGLGKWLMQSLYLTVVDQGLERLLGGSRMPRYHQYKEEMSPEDYVSHIMSGTIQDPVLTFLMRCGRVPLHIIENYIDDDESCNYAVLMEWKNPFK